MKAGKVYVAGEWPDFSRSWAWGEGSAARRTARSLADRQPCPQGARMASDEYFPGDPFRAAGSGPIESRLPEEPGNGRQDLLTADIAPEEFAGVPPSFAADVVPSGIPGCGCKPTPDSGPVGDRRARDKRVSSCPPLDGVAFQGSLTSDALPYDVPLELGVPAGQRARKLSRSPMSRAISRPRKRHRMFHRRAAKILSPGEPTLSRLQGSE